MILPELFHFVRVLQREGARDPEERAQGRPGARCTRGLVCKKVHALGAHEHTGSAETLRPSLRSGFTTYGALSLAARCATIASVMRSIIANLTPASGRQDHTVLPYASRSHVWRHQRVH